MRRPFKIAFCIAVAIPGLVMLLSLIPNRFPPPPAIQVSFLGYTNSPPGATRAVFNITNLARWPVMFWQSRVSIDVEGTDTPLISSTLFVRTTLPPGQGISALVGIPPVKTRWKARWGVSYYNFHQRVVDLKNHLHVPVDLGGDNNIIYAATSDWLAPP
jgi:hypothetical protein